LFEGGSFTAEDKVLRREHAVDGFANLGANRSVLRSQIKLRNRRDGNG